MRKILLPMYRIMHRISFKIPYRYGIEKSYPIKVILKFIRSYLIKVVEVQGHKMFFDSIDILSLLVHEPLETELVKKEIEKGDVVLDIGAHIGYYTLIFAKLVGEEGKVFAFEPEPTNFALLKKNVEIDGYNNIILVQKAVSNKTGKIRLYIYEDDTSLHRIYDSGDGCGYIEIESIKLDDYFRNYDGKIDFIKIDIEGAEEGAIQGMLNLLNKNPNIKILLEFGPFMLKGFGTDPEEYLNLLIKLGFKLYEISDQKPNLTNIPELLKKYTPEKENYTNLFMHRVYSSNNNPDLNS